MDDWSPPLQKPNSLPPIACFNSGASKMRFRTSPATSFPGAGDPLLQGLIVKAPRPPPCPMTASTTVSGMEHSKHHSADVGYGAMPPADTQALFDHEEPCTPRCTHTGGSYRATDGGCSFSLTLLCALSRCSFFSLLHIITTAHLTSLVLSDPRDRWPLR